ncbi:hypothetical protein ACSSV4_001824 [Roseovarius sp. MBR-154]
MRDLLRVSLLIGKPRGALLCVMKDAVIRPFRPEDTAWLVERHGTLYARDGWRLVTSRPVRSYGCDLVEQSWEIAFH